MDFRVLDSITVALFAANILLKFYRHEKLGFLSFCPNVNFSLFLLQMWHYRMIVISIIILLALLFYLFYFSERMKRIRAIVAHPIIGLTIIAISSILFLVADYNGRYYGLSPIIFNPDWKSLVLVSDVPEHMSSLNRFKIIQSRIQSCIFAA